MMMLTAFHILFKHIFPEYLLYLGEKFMFCVNQCSSNSSVSMKAFAYSASSSSLLPDTTQIQVINTSFLALKNQRGKSAAGLFTMYSTGTTIIHKQNHVQVQPPGVTRWQFSVEVEKFNARLAKGCVLSNNDGSWPLASGVSSLRSKELGVPKQSSMY